jgi:hypothetical protein
MVKTMEEIKMKDRITNKKARAFEQAKKELKEILEVE